MTIQMSLIPKKGVIQEERNFFIEGGNFGDQGWLKSLHIIHKKNVA
jgi:hypothetical protein